MRDAASCGSTILLLNWPDSIVEAPIKPKRAMLELWLLSPFLLDPPARAKKAVNFPQMRLRGEQALLYNKGSSLGLRQRRLLQIKAG